MSGYLVRVGDIDTSPVGKLTRDLDAAVDKLMGDPSEEEKGYARGLTRALQVITALTPDEIKQQMMVRYQERQPSGS